MSLVYSYKSINVPSTSVFVERRPKGTAFEVGDTTSAIVRSYVAVEVTVGSNRLPTLAEADIPLPREWTNPC